MAADCRLPSPMPRRKIRLRLAQTNTDRENPTLPPSPIHNHVQVTGIVFARHTLKLSAIHARVEGSHADRAVGI